MGDIKGLIGYSCPKCQRSDFFETKTCPRCHSKMSEVGFSGRGKLVTFTVIRYPPKGFEKDAPYVVGLIDLENGPRIIARIEANPEELEFAKVIQYARKTEGALWFRA